MHRAVLLAFLVGCGGSERTTKPVSHQVPAEPGCDQVTSWRRVTVERDRPLELVGGHRFVYRGDADRMRLHFEMIGATRTTPWKPDRRGTDHERVDGYCVRVISGTRKEVEIELAADSLPPSSSGDCALACCRTPESRKPAPDGTVECCFCAP